MGAAVSLTRSRVERSDVRPQSRVPNSPRKTGVVVVGTGQRLDMTVV